MPRVLFRLPIIPGGLPVYTLGAVIFVAWLLAAFLGRRLASMVGVSKKTYDHWFLQISAAGLVIFCLVFRLFK